MGNKEIRLIVSGGGTGGHLFPGIAVAEAFLDQYPGSRVLFIGTGRQTDARVLANRKFETATISSQGLKGKSMGQRLSALLQLPLSTFSAMGLLRRFRPQLVLGVGGYVTGPVLLAAKMMGIATCIHEQNSVPGMANRKLGRLVDRIFLSIPGSERYFAPGKWVMTGNPLRRELTAAAEKKRGQKEGLTLVVLGGSLGAHRVNTLMVGAMGILKNTTAHLRVIHQTGRDDEQMVAGRYKELGIKAEVAAFFNNMAELYSQADLVVSRAGATTLAEITAFGLPMILIPYPFAADDHQRKNGEYLVQGGAALMFTQEELTEKRLAEEISTLLTDEKRCLQMGQAARRLARPDATKTIVAQCEKLMFA
ncbi:MAG: undecaprenyldiphospho-muramoylpentapeptide beta-N-acetylglucosaminyltransferase [Proteobacteria bacterium]|nr:undecaprenyldiphospho-muramoylpentapeptide beta-N-acetylglucosaminyltransferase [Pseudomonadota bacterium]MBU4294951.1 undecaprenyldiphospho-muramoylpentapeptide beta-N-acetylglucosaminyltransferase [Pseudomonadota bacterium]MCG2747959.1 undecaprenyldiphospho-muramoylpentapeptide beta-N-acetylglucosaminyltransferase [Desulfobulbaceae bacterium]